MEPQKPQPAQPPEQAPASEYEAERRRKRQELRELGVNPYGHRVEGVTPIAAVRRAGEVLVAANLLAAGDGSQSKAAQPPEFTVAGRVMLKRDMGKLSFLTLRDETGDLQIALQKNKLDETGWEIRNRLDLGDLIVATGPLGTTKTGELTIWAVRLQMSSKSLLVPPEKHKGLEDVELRYRRRYVDLWSNPEAMRIAQLRIQIVDRIRRFWRDKGFLEVETPMLQPLHGGAAARPFVTHMNALDMNLYLRIAPELYLKRLLVGGFRKVFEINRNFRNEGISPRHNPEFTMLEAYEAYGSWETMAALVEEMICTIAQEVLGTLVIEHGAPETEVMASAARQIESIRQKGWGHRPSREEIERMKRPAPRVINLEGDMSKPAGQRWARVRMVDVVERRTGWRFTKSSIADAHPEVRDELLLQLTLHLTFATTSSLRTLASAARKHRDAQPLTPDEAVELDRYLRLKKEYDEHGFDPIQADVELDDPEAMLENIRGVLEQVQSDLFSKSPAEQLVHVYEKLVEPTLIDPVFVTHVPSVIIPLARPSEEDPYFAEVYELAINGTEISPGYTELNDPDVQEQLFRAQVGDEAERQQIDEDFLTALKYGMPPAGGMGLGVDRLVAMLTGAPSLRDVILFPLMRPRS